MGWVRFSDDWFTQPNVVNLSGNAFRLYFALVSGCCANKYDGHIVRAVAQREARATGSPKLLAEIAGSGISPDGQPLLIETTEGYVIPLLAERHGKTQPRDPEGARRQQELRDRREAENEALKAELEALRNGVTNDHSDALRPHTGAGVPVPVPQGVSIKAGLGSNPTPPPPASPPDSRVEGTEWEAAVFAAHPGWQEALAARMERASNVGNVDRFRARILRDWLSGKEAPRLVSSPPVKPSVGLVKDPVTNTVAPAGYQRPVMDPLMLEMAEAVARVGREKEAAFLAQKRPTGLLS